MAVLRIPPQATAAGTGVSKEVENQILLLCGQVSDPERGARAADLLAHDVDWAYLLWAAARHGLLGLLYDLALAAGRQFVPAEILRQLRDHHEANTRRNLAALTTTRAVLDILQREAIRALPLRVPSLLARIYDDPGARPSEPVDLLVPKYDIARAGRLLVELGFEPVHDFSGARAGALCRSRALILHDQQRNVRLHLHDRITPDYFPIGLRPVDLWRRRTTMLVDRESAPTPSIEDLLLLTCVDGGHHLWGRLAWVCDVARLLERSSEIDWPALLDRAGTARAGRMLRLGLFLAHDLLAQPLPADVRAAVLADPAVPAIGAQVRNRLLYDLRGRAGERERLRFRLQVRDHAIDRLGYCWWFPLTPTVDDWRELSLPDKLFPLYYAYRPVRLTGALITGETGPQRAPFMTSPMPVVERMLELADLGPDDVLYDLGCGDGRIVITAAQRYGVRGVGIDLDPERVEESRNRARMAGVEHLVTFAQGDVMQVDLSQATVVTVWMLQTLNFKLRPKLEQELQPGARIVGHSFDMGDWIPTRTGLAINGDDTLLAYMWRKE